MEHHIHACVSTAPATSVTVLVVLCPAIVDDRRRSRGQFAELLR